MSTVKHTPGPWQYDEEWFAITAGGQDLAIVRSTRVDARLMLAAPELLEACKALVLLAHHSASAGLTLREIFGTENCVEQPIGTEIKSAIAKAEGAKP